MLFNSVDFFLFLGVVFLLYRAASHRLQNFLLLAASYFFYGYWDYRFLSLILISTVVDYACGLGIAASQTPSRRRLLVSASVCTNLAILVLFKYFGFFAESLLVALGRFGLDVHWTLPSIVLPIGISFYTFQSMGYTIDIYREQTQPTRNFSDFALYVAFFPLLLAGPIERSYRLLPQIAAPRRMTLAGSADGFRLLAWGLFKKVVIADNLASLVDPVFIQTPGAQTPSAVVLWIALYAFAFQIYCDFSGYSDIARGVARMLGFELMLNFNLPYFATNPREYWARWHISLSTWLRDYLYISLAGTRARAPQTRLILTMLIVGLWHGAAWTFVTWGLFHGVWLVLHLWARRWLPRFSSQRQLGARAWRICSGVATFHLICLSLLLFRAESMEQIGWLLGDVMTSWSTQTAVWPLLARLAFFLWPLAIVQVAQYRSGDLDVVGSWPLLVRWLWYSVLFNFFIIWGSFDGTEFIYFQF